MWPYWGTKVAIFPKANNATVTSARDKEKIMWVRMAVETSFDFFINRLPVTLKLLVTLGV